MLPPVNTGSVLALRAQILARSNAISQVAATGTIATPAATGAPQFATAMQDALKSVSVIQGQAGVASDAYDRGDSHDLAGVMIARQKASIAFEATLQIRNRLLGAYKDVMSMPL